MDVSPSTVTRADSGKILEFQIGSYRKLGAVLRGRFGARGSAGNRGSPGRSGAALAGFHVGER